MPGKNDALANAKTVNAGGNMAGNIPQQMLQAKNSAANLPIAQNGNNEVNFRKTPNSQQSIKAYQDQEPTIGITDVYDIE